MKPNSENILNVCHATIKIGVTPETRFWTFFNQVQPFNVSHRCIFQYIILEERNTNHTLMHKFSGLISSDS